MCLALLAPNWFDSHQYVAIWLEGIALVAIFIWDRIDAFQQHKQTLEQMEIIRNQARATETAADAAIAAERAWVMVDVEKAPGAGFITEHTNPAGTYGTSAHIRCICSNQGKTPARLIEIRARLLAGVMPLSIEPDLKIEIFDAGPRYLQPNVPFIKDGGIQGKSGGGIGSMILIYGVVKYRHLFSDKEVHTTFGYRLTPSGELTRLEGKEYRKYNENT